MKLAIDFDGTIVEHQYPYIGPAIPGALESLKLFKESGAQLILWTMRSGSELEEAVEYCAQHGVHFDAVNQGIGDREWTQSSKAYANIYIDDAAFGCPLVYPITGSRPYVDWSQVTDSILNRMAVVSD
jgi:hypothetical protein